jgi:hypothetical protein
MKSITEIRHTLEAQRAYLYQMYGVTEIGIFGSYARNEQRPDSDVDILITLKDPPPISLLGLVDLENYLSDLLGVKADVALRKNLRKRIGSRILDEVITL